jgi:hypothetical protein
MENLFFSLAAQTNPLTAFIINASLRRGIMLCRLLNEGRGCSHFTPADGCDVYPRGGMRFRTRQGYCPIPDDGPSKPKKVAKKGKNRVGQQKQKK